jgi:hypothetical protein
MLQVSVWLMNSNDPIQANYKKNDQYWNGVAEGFNRTILKKIESDQLSK